jgi:hypothetical protein
VVPLALRLLDSVGLPVSVPATPGREGVVRRERVKVALGEREEV